MLGVTFEFPELLLLALPAALLLMAFRRRDARVGAELRSVLARHLEARQTVDLADRRHAQRTTLLGIALFLLLFAAAGPRFGQGGAEETTGPSDVVFLLDVSRSMAAEDLRPNRLAVAKEHVRGFCANVRGESVALIAFADSAHIVVPFTRDTRALVEMLDPLDELSVDRQGTNLAPALTLALSILKRRESPEGGTVYLLTDGEDHEGSAQIVADLLKHNRTILHTIAYGSSQGAKIPTGDPSSPFLRDQEGLEVLTRVDVASLGSLAAATRGDSLEPTHLPTPQVTERGAALTTASPLSKLPRAQGHRSHTSPTRYRIPLLLALLLAFLSLILPTSRPSPPSTDVQ